MKIKVYFTDNGFVVVRGDWSEAHVDTEDRVDTAEMRTAIGKAILAEDFEIGGYGFELEVKRKPITKDIFQ